MTLKQITFKKAKSNYFYAELNEKNELIQVKDPMANKKYFEISIISGGSL